VIFLDHPIPFQKDVFNRIYIILDPKVWLDAMGQVFFTLSIGCGALLAFSSRIRNQLKSNCIRDAYFIVIVNCVTSVLSVCLVSLFGLGGLSVYKVFEYTFFKAPNILHIWGSKLHCLLQMKGPMIEGHMKENSFSFPKVPNMLILNEDSVFCYQF